MKKFLAIISLTLLLAGCKITAITIEIDQDPVDVSEFIEEGDDE